MKFLDERKEKEKPMRALLPNALHFQRDVQNIRVRDLEAELPASWLPIGGGDVHGGSN